VRLPFGSYGAFLLDDHYAYELVTLTSLLWFASELHSCTALGALIRNQQQYNTSRRKTNSSMYRTMHRDCIDA